MWKTGWRDVVWSQLDQTWDMVVIGGGITGAGVFHEAAVFGLKVLLVEAGDFSFGTSSRSSKLVHGGFRYIYNRQYRVTYESVRERETLIREAPGLIETLPFNLPNYRIYRFPGWLIRAGLAIYDLMAPKWDHQKLSSGQLLKRFPGLGKEGLCGGFRYKDAVLDDTRLVLRVIKEGVMMGGTAVNYVRADHLLRDFESRVRGVVLTDRSGLKDRQVEVKARVVVNATGLWTDNLRSELDAPPRMRKLRGSHLILPNNRLPISEAITLFHPKDRRAMFVLPWEGATMVGTTDIDHDPSLEKIYSEPFASQDEITYIMEALHFLFPTLNLSEADILSSFSGLRPIIDTGAESPSRESRAHQIWDEHGLITITGGKLTTYRLMARQTLQTALASIGFEANIPEDRPLLAPLDRAAMDNVDRHTRTYLRGRYGLEASLLLAAVQEGDLNHIEGLPNIWAEVRWATRAEGILRLDDLLLPDGAAEVMGRVREIVQQETGWSDDRWQHELEDYRKIWRSYYSPNPGKK